MSENSTPFVEEDCTVTFDGRSFTSGGAYLLPLKSTGKLAGVMYLTMDGGRFYVEDWHGSVRVPAATVSTWMQYGFGGMPLKCRQVRFRLDGREFTGRIVNEDWTQLLHVRELAS